MSPCGIAGQDTADLLIKPHLQYTLYASVITLDSAVLSVCIGNQGSGEPLQRSAVHAPLNFLLTATQLHIRHGC
jgi:hypothetical protein